MTNRKAHSIVWLFLLLALSSCTKEVQRASGQAGIILEPAAGSVATKGTVMTTAGLFSDGRPILMDALLEAAGRPSSYDAAPHYIVSKSFSYNASEHKWESACQWVDNVFTNFWARYPSDAPAPVFRADGITDSRQRSCSFTYTMPSSTGVTQYARDCCPDLIYAYARKRTSLGASTPDLTVRMKFRHVLAAVCFETGTLREGLTVSEITITGIYTCGTCNLTARPSEDDDNNGDSLEASWESLAGMETAGMTQSVGHSELAGGAMKPGGDKVFFLIPQALGPEAKIKVTFMDGGIPAETYAYIGGSSAVWEPGGRYTYRITFDNDNPSIKLVDFRVDSWDEDGEDLNANKER